MGDLIVEAVGWFGLPITLLVLGIGIAVWLFVKKHKPKIKVLNPLEGSLTAENAAAIIFKAKYTMTSINGIDKIQGVTAAKAASILVPAGKCHLMFNYDDRDAAQMAFGSSLGTTGSCLTATGAVMAGKTYYLENMTLSYEKDKKVMAFALIESGGHDLDEYLNTSRPNYAKRGENITADTMDECLKNITNESVEYGYEPLDMSVFENVGILMKLYEEFYRFNIQTEPGAVYFYSNWHYRVMFLDNAGLDILGGFIKKEYAKKLLNEAGKNNA